MLSKKGKPLNAKVGEVSLSSMRVTYWRQMPPATLWVAWNKKKGHSGFLSLLALKDRCCSGLFRTPCLAIKEPNALRGECADRENLERGALVPNPIEPPAQTVAPPIGGRTQLQRMP